MSTGGSYPQEGLDGEPHRVRPAIQILAASALVVPMIVTIPLQLLAYHMAEMRGNDLDPPRNPAKSVMVE